MPSVSKKQHNLMAMVANDPAAAKRVGIPQSVGKDFLQADKGMKFGNKTRVDSQRVNKPKTEHGSQALFSKGGEMKESKTMAKKEIAFMEKKGAPKSMIKHEKAEYGMKSGGMTKMGSVRTAAPSRDGLAAKGKTKGKMVVMKRGGKAC